MRWLTVGGFINRKAPKPQLRKVKGFLLLVALTMIDVPLNTPPTSPTSVPTPSQLKNSMPDPPPRPFSLWHNLFRWYWPTSDAQSAQSEVHLLETHGGIPLSTQPHKAQLKRVYLDAPSPAPTPGDSTGHNPRFINTLILDENGVEESAKGRQNVVVCHGFGAGIGFFYRNLWPMSRMLPGSRIYAIDMLGMGRSGRPSFPKYNKATPTKSTTEAAVNFFIDSFEEWRLKQDGLDEFVLVGHSMGGYLSALYALKHPERVQKLILASPVGLPEQGKEMEGVALTGHRIPSFFSYLWDANYTPQGLIRAAGPTGKTQRCLFF